MADDTTFIPIDGKAAWFKGQLLPVVGADNKARPVGSDNPMPVFMVGGTGGGDSDAATEATLEQVRVGILNLAALLGNTDNLEALAAQTNTLLTTLGTYNDQVEILPLIAPE